MTEGDDQYEVVMTATALRALSRLSPRVSEPLVAFIFGSLKENPRRRGNPLKRDLAGSWSARRGDYRVVYQIDTDAKVITITAIGSPAHVYRPR